MDILKTSLNKSLSFVVLILFVSSVGTFAQSYKTVREGKVDFKGVENFWPILGKLEADREPKEQEWKRLFNTPAYSFVTKNISEKRLKKRFRIAFMPSKYSLRDSILKEGGYTKRILMHLLNTAKQREDIEHFADSLKKVSLLQHSLDLTSLYLPVDFIKNNKELYPPIAFGIFEPDGYANKDIIAIDIGFSRTINLKKFLAHEAHHFFINKIRKKTRQPKTKGIMFLLRSIRQLHLEGIADLIDKKEVLDKSALSENEDWYAYNFNNYYSSTPETLKKIDALLIDSQATEQPKGKEIWDLLHFGAHPEGMYLALTIEKAFGRNHIIKILENPFEIIWSYQQAAKNSSTLYSFSSRSIEYLKTLEREYLID